MKLLSNLRININFSISSSGLVNSTSYLKFWVDILQNKVNNTEREKSREVERDRWNRNRYVIDRWGRMIDRQIDKETDRQIDRMTDR